MCKISNGPTNHVMYLSLSFVVVDCVDLIICDDDGYAVALARPKVQTSDTERDGHSRWNFFFFLSAQSHDTNRNGYMNFSRKPQDHWPFSLKEFRNEENRT